MPERADDGSRGYCLDASYGRAASGVPAVVGLCTGSATQQWSSEYAGGTDAQPYVRLHIAANPSLCLTAVPQAVNGSFQNLLEPCASNVNGQLYTVDYAR